MELQTTSSSPSGTELSLEHELVRLHGFIIDSDALWRLLCYSTPDAFRQAVRRRTCPIKVFSIAHRRGHFALAKTVAAWLALAIAESDDVAAGRAPSSSEQRRPLQGGLTPTNSTSEYPSDAATSTASIHIEHRLEEDSAMT